MAGCAREATELSEYLPYTGTAPLSIRGVRPGQGEGDVVALFGPPDRRHGSGGGPESLLWQRFGDMVVTVDARTSRVTEVLGDRLTAADDVVVQNGMLESDVRAILGRPASDQGQFGPSGSGVVSLRMKETGRTLSYRRDGLAIEVTVRDGRLAYVRLRLAAS